MLKYDELFLDYIKKGRIKVDPKKPLIQNMKTKKIFKVHESTVITINKNHITAPRLIWIAARGIPNALVKVIDPSLPVTVDNLKLITKNEIAFNAIYNARHRFVGKLTWAGVQEIRYLLRNNVGVCEIARRYNVRSSTISNIISGKTWDHLEYQEPAEPPAIHLEYPKTINSIKTVVLKHPKIKSRILTQKLIDAGTKMSRRKIYELIRQERANIKSNSRLSA